MRRWRGLLAELESLASHAREPALWLLVALTLVGATAAYSTRWSWTLDIGGRAPVSPDCYAAAVFDTPFESGFNLDPEFDAPQNCAASTLAYRWAYDDARLTVPDVGHAPLDTSLRVTRGQDEPVTSRWSLADEPLLAVPIQPLSRVYHVLLPSSDSGDLALHLETPRFRAPGDSRPIAFAAESFSIAALARPLPPLSQLAWLTATTGAFYVLARRWRVPRLPLFWIGLGLVAILGALLVGQRPNLTIFTPRLAMLLIAAYPLTLLLEAVTAALARLSGIAGTARESRMISALIVLAWLIRVVGLFHPQTFMSDTGLNVNNLLGVMQGEVLFMESLPARAGGGAAPYPPAQYLLLLPFAPLVPTTRTLVMAGAALADSLAILWVWLLLRGAGESRMAATFAGVLYLFATPLLRSLNIGEMANVWGQALVLPWILTLLLWRKGRAPTWLLAAVSAIALVGHFGVFLSLLAFAASYFALLLLRRDPQAARLIAIGGGALLFATAIYYGAFPDAILNRPAAQPPETRAELQLMRQVDELTRLTGRIGPLLTALGVGGVVVAWRRNPHLRDLLLAWWLSVALSWVTLLFSQQALRWPAFVFPAVAAGGGLVLERLWQRDSPRRLAAIALAGLAVTQGALLWLEHLITYR